MLFILILHEFGQGCPIARFRINTPLATITHPPGPSNALQYGRNGQLLASKADNLVHALVNVRIGHGNRVNEYQSKTLDNIGIKT